MRLLLITLMILTLSVGTANAATSARKATVVKAKKVTTTAKKSTATKTSTKAKTLVKGEKVTAQSVSVIGNNTISTYTVKSGDTLSGIAQKFDITVNTIRWSNNITSKDSIHIGQKITILPTSGIVYTVKSGDTLSGIAQKFSADQNDILNSNNLNNADSLKTGMTLIIPNVEPVTPTSSNTVGPAQNISTIAPETTIPPIQTPATQSGQVITPPVTAIQTPAGSTIVVTNPVTAITYPITVTSPTGISTYPIPVNDIRGYYAQPITGRLSQGIHAVNAVDIAAPVGTSVHAAADGTIIVAMGDGRYNGGYGNYMVIAHPNGTQTLYAHLSKVIATLGEMVTQGQPVALSGNSGRTTGAHLHFEIRGATNPWGSDPIGTEYSI